MNGKELYNKLSGYRDSWLCDAEESERLTLPSLRVRGHAHEHKGELIRAEQNPRPYTNVGRDGVHTLANTILTLLFPLDIRWFRLKIDENQKQALLDEGVYQSEEEIEEALRAIEDRMIAKMDDHFLRSNLHQLLKRNLVEGNNVLHLYIERDNQRNIIESGLRVVPLRSMVIRRRHGKPTKLVIEDQYETDSGEIRRLYTTVDYQDGKVKQFEDGTNRVNDKAINDQTSFYIPVTSSMPTIEDYADSYIFELLGDLNLHNNLNKSVDEGVAMAAFILLANQEDKSGLSLHDLQQMKSGEAFEGQVSGGVADGIGVVSTGVIANNMSFVVQWMQEIEARLTKQFAGLLSAITENFTQPRTATEISRLSSELDTFAAGLGSIYNANLQRPLAQAYLDLVQLESGGQGSTVIRPTIVAGNSQLSRLQELSKFLQAISTQLQMNPEFAYEIKWRQVWDRVTNALGIDTDDVLKSEEEKQQEGRAVQQQAQLQQADQIRESQLQALRQQRIAENQGNAGRVA